MVTSSQFAKMRHALGMDYKSKPWRNYYYCNTNDAEWNDLVNKGFATKGEGHTEEKAYFFVTFEGAKLVYGKRMSKKYFNGL